MFTPKTPVFLSKCAHFSQVQFFWIIRIQYYPFLFQQLTKAHKEGLGLPFFQHEYWAHNSKAWGFWNRTVAGLKHFREMSRIESSNVLSPTGASFSAILNVIYSSNCRAATLCSSLTILKGRASLRELSIHAPKCQNLCFKPSLTHANFKQWSKRGLSTIKNLHVLYRSVCFTHLQEKLNFPLLGLWVICKLGIWWGSVSLAIIPCQNNMSSVTLRQTVPSPNNWSLSLLISSHCQPTIPREVTRSK